jgi:hypothetical protein
VNRQKIFFVGFENRVDEQRSPADVNTLTAANSRANQSETNSGLHPDRCGFDALRGGNPIGDAVGDVFRNCENQG